MLAAVREAFVGHGELTERQGAALLVGAGAVFSVTAISVAAVDEASDFQFLTYRGASTALAMLLLVAVRRGGRPVSFVGLTPTVWLAGLMLSSQAQRSPCGSPPHLEWRPPTGSSYAASSR